MTDDNEKRDIDEHAKNPNIAKFKEDPLEINGYVESLRRWVKSMPHLNCPTDSNFLLRFLRTTKFDRKKAEERLDNFCTIRSSSRGAPECFEHIRMDDPIVDEFLNLRYQIPLGRAEGGELIILFRIGHWNPDKIPFNKYINLMFKGINLMLENEESQIYGIKTLIDVTDAPRRNVVALCNPKLVWTINKLFQDCIPTELKDQIFYNAPLIFDIVFEIYTFFMNSKMRNRTILLRNNMKSVIERIPGIIKILPTEYGGQGGPISEISEKWNKTFKNYYQNGDPLGNISVDESKRPQAMFHLGEPTEYKGPILDKEDK